MSAVDQGGTCVPLIASGYMIKASERLETSVIANAQHLCRIVPAHIDVGTDRDATAKFEIALRDRVPCTIGASSTQRFAPHNGERVAASIARKTSD